MTTYDRLIFGMHHMAISQIGSGYDGKYHYSHVGYEIDFTGSDSGVDYYKNMMPNTYWKCAGAFGTASTGNTRFFWSCDANGNAKKVLCADGVLRLITLALTHSNRSFTVGKLYSYKEVMYQEGTSGYATGNHIHMELCAGHVKTKVRNSKGGYNLANMLPINKMMYVLSSYTTIVSTGGLSWKKCTTVPYTVQSTSSNTGERKFNSKYANGKQLIVKTSAGLNMRKDASTSSASVKLLKNGTKLMWYGYYKLVNNIMWYYVTDGKAEGYVYGGKLNSGVAPYLKNANP